MFDLLDRHGPSVNWLHTLGVSSSLNRPTSARQNLWGELLGSKVNKPYWQCVPCSFYPRWFSWLAKPHMIWLLKLVLFFFWHLVVPYPRLARLQEPFMYITMVRILEKHGQPGALEILVNFDIGIRFGSSIGRYFRFFVVNWSIIFPIW